ncbi:hypothetical protein N7486_009798 [Penicillium sp. IBT 16267x]|nr:hypothetical protein N7486_009798 [Penicillium sp. IBT 16267x]
MSGDILAEKNDVKHAEFAELDDIDPAAEKKLLRKVDVHVVPALFALFLLAFLDRVNIGNAKIFGLEEELGMTGSQYSIGLMVFFIPYILLEVPSNIMIRKVAPSTWLCGIMFLWGIATIGMGLIRNFGGLIAMRLLLGAFEAGLFPGCVYLISMYYKRHELQWRMNLFFSASILAGAFGGLLAYLIANLDGKAGYAGWRWIFIIEGLLTCVVGITLKYFVVDWPETAKFLTEEERVLLSRRLAGDVATAKMDRLDRAASKRIYGDWKIWCGTLMYMGALTTGYASSFFLPTIIKELGVTSTAAQVRSIPIFVVAAILSLTVGWVADRLRHRYAFIMLGVAFGTVGYSICLGQNGLPTGVKYMACFLITSGGYMAQPVTLVWLSNNVGGHYKRSISSALQVGLGNCGGIIASNVFISHQAPLYPIGYGVSLGMLLLTSITATVFLFGLIYENKMRDQGKRDWRLGEPDSEIENMGDDHPHFRFTL